MAPKPSLVCDDVPRGETDSQLSPNCDSVTGSRGQPRSDQEEPCRNAEAAVYASLRLHAAKKIWPIRYDLTPSHVTTWVQWFINRFGISLDELREQTRKKNEV